MKAYRKFVRHLTRQALRGDLGAIRMLGALVIAWNQGFASGEDAR
jgi:hypothetical protein